MHKVDLSTISMRLALLLFLYIEFGVYQEVAAKINYGRSIKNEAIKK